MHNFEELSLKLGLINIYTKLEGVCGITLGICFLLFRINQIDILELYFCFPLDCFKLCFSFLFEWFGTSFGGISLVPILSENGVDQVCGNYVHLSSVISNQKGWLLYILTNNSYFIYFFIKQILPYYFIT